MLAGCTTSDSNPADAAKPYAGLHERENREYLTDILGVDPVRTEWCAAFVNAVLEDDGLPNLYNQDHPYPLLARSFLDWGIPINYQDIQYGDLVIFPRGTQGWQGHVGIYIGRYPPTGELIILGGNQDKKVGYNLYKSSNIIGIRRFNDKYDVRSNYVGNDRTNGI